MRFCALLLLLVMRCGERLCGGQTGLGDAIALQADQRAVLELT